MVETGSWCSCMFQLITTHTHTHTHTHTTVTLRLMFYLAQVGGSLLLISGGLAAPAMGPLFISVAAMVGASATTAALIGAWSIPVLTALFGAAGASLGSYNAATLTAEIKDFAFVPVPLPERMMRNVQENNGLFVMRDEAMQMPLTDTLVDLSASVAWAMIDGSVLPSDDAKHEQQLAMMLPSDTLSDVACASEETAPTMTRSAVDMMMTSSYLLDCQEADRLMKLSVLPPAPSLAAPPTPSPDASPTTASDNPSVGDDDTATVAITSTNGEQDNDDSAPLLHTTLRCEREMKPLPDIALSTPGAHDVPDPVLPGK
jgi:hypothetical protein